MIIILLTACNKQLNTLEQDYYIIIHDIIPLHKQFEDKSSEPLYQLKNNIEKGADLDIDKTISDIEKVQNDTIKLILEKSKNIKSDTAKKYINIKVEYIDNVCNFSKDMLIEFKNIQDKSMQSFINILQSHVIKSSDKINSLLKEEEKLIEEIKNMVEQK